MISGKHWPQRQELIFLPGVLSGREKKIYNKATVYAPDGKILAIMPKIHLYNQERETITPGDQLSIF